MIQMATTEEDRGREISITEMIRDTREDAEVARDLMKEATEDTEVARRIEDKLSVMNSRR